MLMPNLNCTEPLSKIAGWIMKRSPVVTLAVFMPTDPDPAAVEVEGSVSDTYERSLRLVFRAHWRFIACISMGRCWMLVPYSFSA
jgi:hypothetical protein